MNTALRISLLALFPITLLACTATAQTPDSDAASDRTIEVSGEGTVRAAPDQATVRFGVVSRAPEAEAARSKNADAASRAMNAVRDLDVSDERIRMEQLRLREWTEFDPQTRERKRRGFEAIRTVVVEVNDLDRLPTLVTEVVQQGANRLDGIEYGLQDETSVRNEALQEAARNARDKARLLAETLGADLGAVQTIREQSLDVPRFRTTLDASAMKSASAEAAPNPDAFAAGEIEVRANVSVVFRIQ